MDIFVFGSNLAGRHGAGAAKKALIAHGAIYGNGVGPQGQSYAIPTKGHQLQVLDLPLITSYVYGFIKYAKQHPELTFNVTRIGCGLAGYTDAQIAPMFRDAPDNCKLPQGWRSPMKEFKLIVAGGRDFNDRDLMVRELNDLCDTGGPYANYHLNIVSGMARGADALGHSLAKENHIPVYEFSADWDKHGKRAGFIRNEAMGRFADALIAFWDGESRGTSHMISFMQSLKKPVHIVRY